MLVHKSAHIKATRLLGVYFSLCPFALKFLRCAQRYSKAIKFVSTRYRELRIKYFNNLKELKEHVLT